jgi:hypothetical protein
MLHGRCHCGAIAFEMPDAAAFATVCHCTDCRRQSGAPVLAWAMVPAAAVTVRGEPRVYRSSESGRRSFCPDCGTGLFFANAALAGMGMMQVRIAALDDPGAIAPQMQVQVAERIGWMVTLDALPAVDRFPAAGD